MSIDLVSVILGEKLASSSGTVDATWGSIKGNIDNQTDLKDALDNKANDTAVVHKTGQEIIKGNKRFDDNIYFPTSSYTGYYKINKDGVVYTKSGNPIRIDFPVPTSDDKLALLSDITGFDTLNTIQY